MGKIVGELDPMKIILLVLIFVTVGMMPAMNMGL